MATTTAVSIVARLGGVGKGSFTNLDRERQLAGPPGGAGQQLQRTSGASGS